LPKEFWQKILDAETSYSKAFYTTFYSGKKPSQNKNLL
jgi:hypothetical protein